MYIKIEGFAKQKGNTKELGLGEIYVKYEDFSRTFPETMEIDTGREDSIIEIRFQEIEYDSTKKYYNEEIMFWMIGFLEDVDKSKGNGIMACLAHATHEFLFELAFIEE